MIVPQLAGRKTETLGRAKRKGVGGKEFLPALAFSPPQFFVQTKLAHRQIIITPTALISQAKFSNWNCKFHLLELQNCLPKYSYDLSVLQIYFYSQLFS